MAAMKANGKLKSYLRGCTYGEAVSRISQVARDQDLTASKELQLCRENHKKVGLKYASALMNSKAAAMNFSCVEKTSELCITQFFVKETNSSNARCEVDLDTTVSWRGGHFQIVTGTCSYFLTTRMICPCACATHDFIECNMNKFVGVKDDGNDAIFQYPWGQMNRLKIKCNPATSRTRFMTTEVMSGIWSNRIDYSSTVGKAHWMDSGYLLPIIAYKYKISKIVLYDNSGTDTHSVDGGWCFTTYVYCYDMTNQNAVFLQILCMDWLMTFVVPVGLHAWFSFVSNNISCYLSMLIPVIKI